MRKIVFLSIFLMLGGIVNADSSSQALPLKLTIQTDKRGYSVGEEIKISFKIENKGLEPIGFYVKDYGDLIISVTDGSNHPYDYYYDQAVQRWAPLLYPYEYVLLKPNEKWEGIQSLRFQKGEIKTYEGTKLNPRWKVVHDGYYLACPNCSTYDSVLLPQSAFGEIKISAKYTTPNPNPKNSTRQDCEEAHVSLDAFPDDFTSNKILHGSIKCDQNSCPDFFDPMVDPMDSMERHNLAVFCQHYSSLTKKAWIGTLESNSITINLNEN